MNGDDGDDGVCLFCPFCVCVSFLFCALCATNHKISIRLESVWNFTRLRLGGTKQDLMKNQTNTFFSFSFLSGIGPMILCDCCGECCGDWDGDWVWGWGWNWVWGCTKETKSSLSSSRSS